MDTIPQVSGVSSEKARANLKPDTRHLKPMLREGFTTPDNVPKKDLFFNHVTRSECYYKKDKVHYEKFGLFTFQNKCYWTVIDQRYIHHSLEPAGFNRNAILSDLFDKSFI